ncbi:hypothetical protein D1872_265630 [compost metagenome]
MRHPGVEPADLPSFSPNDRGRPDHIIMPFQRQKRFAYGRPAARNSPALDFIQFLAHHFVILKPKRFIAMNETVDRQPELRRYICPILGRNLRADEGVLRIHHAFGQSMNSFYRGKAFKREARQRVRQPFHILQSLLRMPFLHAPVQGLRRLLEPGKLLLALFRPRSAILRSASRRHSGIRFRNSGPWRRQTDEYD